MIIILNRNYNYRHHQLIHRILWGALLVITIIVVVCDVTLFFKDRSEKKQAATQQHTRVIKKRPTKSESKLVLTHRPKRQHWPRTKADEQSSRYQAQAKQAVNNTGVNPQTKDKLLTAFSGLQPNQQRHVLQIINSNLSNQQKMAAIKSYVIGG